MQGTGEQRIFDRFSARYPAKFKDSRDDYGTSVHLRNASAEGIQITSKEQLFLNDSVTLEVALPDGNNPMKLRGQVVWSKKTSTNQWDVGVKFHKTRLLHMSRLYKFVADLPQ